MSKQPTCEPRLVCATCGSDRAGEEPGSACQHERDYLSFAGDVGQDECGETAVLCYPETITWAALDMLEALKAVRDTLPWETSMHEVRKARQMMNAAIAKAEGGTEWAEI